MVPTVKLSLLTIFAAVSLSLVIMPRASAATVPQILANSSPAQNSSQFMSLTDYAGQRPFVDWPLRSQGCSASSATIYKTIPWLAANPNSRIYNGNNFLTSGNCSDRYNDGGNPRGGWLDPAAFGGWALPSGGTLAETPPIFTGSGKTAPCNSFPGGPAPRIWGRSFIDSTDQSVALFRGNGFPSYTPAIGRHGTPLYLYTGGTTILRNQFNLTAPQLAELQSPTSTLTLQILADDFFKVYVNGVAVSESDLASNRSFSNLGSAKSLFLEGKNVISVQAVDKALWFEAGFGPPRGVGLCYSLALFTTGTPASVCPGDPIVAASKNQPVTLSPQNVPTDTGSSGGYSGSPSVVTGYGYTASGNYEITSVKDTPWGQAATSFSPTVKSPGPFSVDYTRWMTDYPYDHHNINVDYKTYYDRHIYKSATAATYYCTSGILNGSNCVTTTTVAGTANSASPPMYTCPAGYSGGGFSSTCTSSTSTPASIEYAISEDTAAKTIDYGSAASTTPANPHTLAECFPRNFRVTDADTNAGSPAPTYDDSEDPKTVTVTAITVAEFSLQHGGSGLRVAASVNNLGYLGDYTVQHASSGSPFTLSLGTYFPRSSPDAQTISTIGTVTPPTNGSWLASTANTYTNTIPVSAPPLVAGDQICAQYTVTPAGTEVDETGAIVPGTAGGSAVSAIKCGNTFSDAPYTHLLGLDASAGGAMATSLLDKCSTAPIVGVPPGTITGNIKPVPLLPFTRTRGSGSQFAALANGPISNFNSATLRTTTPISIGGLTFANAPPLSYGSLGVKNCIPNYYKARPATTSALLSGDLSSFSGSGKTGAYTWGTDTVAAPLMLTKGVGTGIKAGNRVSIYVHGDVYIKDNIEFKTTTNWNAADVPSFYLVAEGNIYIDPSVTVLDGVYVSQKDPSGTGGTIDTCATNSGKYPLILYYDNCKTNQLMVNGAFVADQINLLRISSSIRTALDGEYPATAGGRCDGNVRTGSRPSSSHERQHDCAADIINFSPETYLSEPSMIPIGGPSSGKYDYITSLSPVL